MTQSNVPCGSPPALQVELTASLLIGQSVASDSAFPSAVTTISFALNPPCKGYAVDTKGIVNVQSPSAFVTLPGVGTAVTQGQFIYLRAPAGFQVRLTMANPGGGSPIVSIFTCSGLFINEFNASSGYLELLEVMGTGVVEYYVNGQA